MLKNYVKDTVLTHIIGYWFYLYFDVLNSSDLR